MAIKTIVKFYKNERRWGLLHNTPTTNKLYCYTILESRMLREIIKYNKVKIYMFGARVPYTE